MLRLIAIRPLDGCRDYTLKCLHADETYYFCNLFDIAEDGTIVRRRIPQNTAYEGIYQINYGPTKLMLSAIVGKNGDGKSSIVELMLRLINNYAVVALRNTKEPDSLVPVKGVCASLYYMIGNDIFRLYDEEGNGQA